MIKSLLNNVYYYQDQLGSTTHVANASGTLIESYKYDLYGAPAYYDPNGQLKANQVPGYGVNDLYAGERWIPELRLYDLRNRFMSPELGRFLQPDPIGFKGDASNLYRYCHNDPEDFIDPMGLVDEWQKQMLWQGGGDGSVSEQIARMDAAAGIQGPPADGHVTIEKARVVEREFDRTKSDSQSKDVDDEHFADRGGGIAEGQPPGLTTAHTYTSNNAVVRPVIFTQYGRHFVDPDDGKLKSYGERWRAKACSGEADHQREIARDLGAAKIQKIADAAYARGGVPELRKVMNAATSKAVKDSGFLHHNPITGDHHISGPPSPNFPYTAKPLPYDQ